MNKNREKMKERSEDAAGPGQAEGPVRVVHELEGQVQVGHRPQAGGHAIGAMAGHDDRARDARRLELAQGADDERHAVHLHQRLRGVGPVKAGAAAGGGDEGVHRGASLFRGGPRKGRATVHCARYSTHGAAGGAGVHQRPAPGAPGGAGVLHRGAAPETPRR